MRRWRLDLEGSKEDEEEVRRGGGGEVLNLCMFEH